MKVKLTNGEEREVSRCPKYVMWRHGRAASIFAHRIQEIARGYKDLSAEDQGMMLLETMTDDEGEKFEAFADDVVRHSFKPALKDVSLVKPEDYMPIFAKTFYGEPDAKVETEGGEASIQDVETFPDESAISETSEDVSHLRPEAVRSSRIAGAST